MPYIENKPGVGPGQTTDIGLRAPMSDKGGGFGRLLY